MLKCEEHKGNIVILWWVGCGRADNYDETDCDDCDDDIDDDDDDDDCDDGSDDYDDDDPVYMAFTTLHSVADVIEQELLSILDPVVKAKKKSSYSLI